MTSSFKRFDVDLDLRYISESEWMVLADLTYHIGWLGSGVTVTAPKGYITDGASVPKAVWGIISPWTSRAGPAFIIHDVLCDYPYLTYHQDSGQKLQIKVDRKRVDSILSEALEVLDTEPWKVKAIMAAVNYHRISNNIT